MVILRGLVFEFMVIEQLLQHQSIQPLLILNCSVHEVGSLKIHGNYCGSNWTAGKSQPSNAPNVDWSVLPIDALDAACRIHDISCSKSGCTATSDRKLSAQAYFISLINPKLAPIAQLVSAGMLASSFRRSK